MSGPSQGWISVDALGAAFADSENLVPPSSDLVSRSFRLSCERGTVEEYTFESDSRLLVSNRTKGEIGKPTLESYTASRIRDDYYLVSFVPRRDPGTVAAVLFDLEGAAFTKIAGRLPSAEKCREPLHLRARHGVDLSGFEIDVSHGGLGDAGAKARHAATSDLVGRRIEYVYSQAERYEHVYLNERLFTWHCLEGAERGLADTDRCEHLKVGKGLCLFSWREKIVPTLGVIAIDLAQMKTTGRIFGYAEQGFDDILSFPVAAKARFATQVP